MPGCTAPNCTNSSRKGFKLYHFPSDNERNQIWAKNCGREEGWTPTRHTCVCEVHFEESQFESHRADGLRKLKPYAIPTLFDHSKPSHSSKKKVKKPIIDDVPEVPEEKHEASKSSDLNPEKSQADSADEWTPSRPRILRASKRQPSHVPVEDNVESVSPVRKSARISIRGRRKWTDETEGEEGEKEEENTSGSQETSSETVQEEKEEPKLLNCFVCHKPVEKGSSLTSLTPTTKVSMQQKIARIVAGQVAFTVQPEDIVCPECTRMIHYVDRIEVELSMLNKAILNCLRKKYVMEQKLSDGTSNAEHDVSGVMKDFVQSDDVLKEMTEIVNRQNAKKQKTESEEDKEVSQGPDSPEQTMNDMNELVENSDNLQNEGEHSESLACLIKEVDGDADSDTVEPPATGEEPTRPQEQELETKKESVPSRFNCLICDFKTNFKSVIIFHLRQHVSGTFRCDFCNKAVPRPNTTTICMKPSKHKCKVKASKLKQISKVEKRKLSLKSQSNHSFVIAQTGKPISVDNSSSSNMVILSQGNIDVGTSDIRNVHSDDQQRIENGITDVISNDNPENASNPIHTNAMHDEINSVCVKSKVERKLISTDELQVDYIANRQLQDEHTPSTSKIENQIIIQNTKESKERTAKDIVTSILQDWD